MSNSITAQAREYRQTGGRISKAEAQALVQMAKADGRVTEAEKGEIAHVLDDFRQTDAATRVFAKFLGLP